MEIDSPAATGIKPLQIITSNPQGNLADRSDKPTMHLLDLDGTTMPFAVSSQPEKVTSSTAQPSQNIEISHASQVMDGTSYANTSSTGLDTATVIKGVALHSPPSALQLRNTLAPSDSSTMENSSDRVMNPANAKNKKVAVIASRPRIAPSAVTSARPLQAISSNGSIRACSLGLVLKRRRSAVDVGQRPPQVKKRKLSEPTKQSPSSNVDQEPDNSAPDASEEVHNHSADAKNDNRTPEKMYRDKTHRHTEDRSVMPPPPLPAKIAGRKGKKKCINHKLKDRVKIIGLDDRKPNLATGQAVKTDNSNNVPAENPPRSIANTKDPQYLTSIPASPGTDSQLFDSTNTIAQDSKISVTKPEASISEPLNSAAIPKNPATEQETSISKSSFPTPMPVPEDGPQNAYHDGNVWRCETCDLSLHHGRCPSHHRLERCEECGWELLGGDCPCCAIDREDEELSYRHARARDIADKYMKSESMKTGWEEQCEGMVVDGAFDKESEGVLAEQAHEETGEENGAAADHIRNMRNEILLEVHAKASISENEDQERTTGEPAGNTQDTGMSQDANLSNITDSERQLEETAQFSGPETIYDPLDDVLRCALCTYEIETDDGIEAYCSGPEHHIISPIEIEDWEPAYASSEDDSEDEGSDTDDDDFLSDNEDDWHGALGHRKRSMREVKEGKVEFTKGVQTTKAGLPEKDKLSSSTKHTATSDPNPHISTTAQISTPQPIAKPGWSIPCIYISSPHRIHIDECCTDYHLVLNSTSNHIRIYPKETKVNGGIPINSIDRVIYSPDFPGMRFELWKPDQSIKQKVIVDIETDLMVDDSAERLLQQVLMWKSEVKVVRVDKILLYRLFVNARNGREGRYPQI